MDIINQDKNINLETKWDDFRFIDLFAGIGGIRLGFEAVGGRCVFSSELDADACKTYEANFGEYPFGDITKIDAAEIPDFDILLGGFPCQAFSIIGKKEGFANETCGTLFFDIERILKEKRPPAFMLENVRNLVAHDKGNTFRIIKSHLEALDYHVYAKVLNALDYGVPQKRERIIIVGFLEDVMFEFPDPVPESERKKLVDILETNIDSKYYVRDTIRKSRLERIKDKNYPKPYISHENIAGSITPHPYSSALRAGASANYILINDERRPTEREMLRIQGFPDTYKIVLSYTKVKHQCGNSVAVPVIKAVAKEMLDSLKTFERNKNMAKKDEAKKALDMVIKKSRVHLYKPIQIAEILYRVRTVGDINPLELEDYRTRSKKWRDEICKPLLGRVCTSSARFQDDLFNDNAVPPAFLNELSKENLRTGGAVEAYIYRQFTNKHDQLSDALLYCLDASRETFDVKHFIDSFWNEPGLKRSLDKIYEIIVYALFSTLVDALNLKVEVSVDENHFNVLSEFEDFSKKIMCLDFSNPTHLQDARVYRVGVTNAADRGLDMYSNWGPAIQIKHLSLDVSLAENIVGSVSSDRVVIVCKEAEKDIIVSLLTQIGWRSHIQSIVTESDLVLWYEKALRGRYADIIGDSLIECLCDEIAEEFPSVDNIPDILKNRHYENISDPFWS
jgi:DNA-cytosine methyltransferase